MNIKNEPALVAAIVPFVVMLAARYTLPLTFDQATVLVGAAIGVAAYWSRSKTTPVALGRARIAAGGDPFTPMPEPPAFTGQDVIDNIQPLPLPPPPPPNQRISKGT